MSKTTGTTPDIPILHEDAHLLVIVKPPGLLSQKDRTGDPDLLTLCRGYLEQKHQRSGGQFLGLLHRLDRPVQGVMVLAKRPSAASHLSAQIRDHTFGKIYLAVVEGATPPNGVLAHHLVKDPSTNHVTASRKETPGQTQRAELSFVRLDYHRDKNLSFLQIQLLTGRPHQIRVQFASEGYPLYGDQKYGYAGREDRTDPALFARGLKFRHPETGKPVTYTADPPDHYPWNLFSRGS